MHLQFGKFNIFNKNFTSSTYRADCPVILNSEYYDI